MMRTIGLSGRSKKTWGTIGALALAVSVGAVVAAACDDDPHRRTSPEQALGGGGGACSAEAGTLPVADCDNSDNRCENPLGQCSIDEARCGSKSTCLPLTDNKGKNVLDFRIRRLNIAAPAALAADFIQNTVVTLNIDMAERVCGEQGKGLFTWLMRLDKTNKQLITGGAPPSDDVFNQGYCFARFDLGPNKVEPTTLPVEISADNKVRSTDKRKVNIPIFLTQDIESVIILPISDVVVDNVTLSDDGNCIGRFKEAALDTSCFEDKSLCPRWGTAGALGGYITLEEADAVKIRDLNNKSLCSFLAGATELSCPRDAQGKIVYQGDYCSTDKQKGSCADSVWLAATFAASAVKIFDGSSTIKACSGVKSETDAGTDAAPSEAGADGGDGG